MAAVSNVPDVSRNVMLFRSRHIGKTAFFSLEKCIIGPFYRVRKAIFPAGSISSRGPTPLSAHYFTRLNVIMLRVIPLSGQLGITRHGVRT